LGISELADEGRKLQNECTALGQAYRLEGARLSRWYWALGCTVAGVSAVAGATALAQFDVHNIIAGSLALGVAVLGSVSTFFNAGGRAKEYQGTATDYGLLATEAREFSAIDCVPGADLNKLTERVKALAKEKGDIARKAPQLPESVIVGTSPPLPLVARPSAPAPSVPPPTAPPPSTPPSKP